MTTSPSGKIGLIGIGLLGSAMAERLLQAGISVIGYDLDPSRMDWLATQGGAVARNPNELFTSGVTILLSLPTSRHVAELFEASELPTDRSLLIIDTTTGSPDEARLLGERLASRSIEYLDATILGSSNDLRLGEAILMAGGTPSAFLRAIPFIETLVKKSFHVGPWGAGSKMKLVVNLVLGLNRAVLAEGLSFARQLGFDLCTTLEILSSGVAYSRVMETKGPRMISEEFSPQARLRQHHKDVLLILEQAASHQLQLPLSQLHESLLGDCIAAGWGELDNSAVIKRWQRQD